MATSKNTRAAGAKPASVSPESDHDFYTRHAREARASRDRWMAWARQDREAAAAHPTQRDAFLSLVSQNVQSARRCSREALSCERDAREAKVQAVRS